MSSKYWDWPCHSFHIFYLFVSKSQFEPKGLRRAWQRKAPCSPQNDAGPKFPLQFHTACPVSFLGHSVVHLSSFQNENPWEGRHLAGNATCCHHCHTGRWSPIPSAFPVCPMPGPTWGIQGCGGALSDNNKQPTLPRADRIILEKWRHLIAALQALKNYYKQYSVARNDFCPHPGNSIAPQ